MIMEGDGVQIGEGTQGANIEGLIQGCQETQGDTVLDLGEFGRNGGENPISPSIDLNQRIVAWALSIDETGTGIGSQSQRTPNLVTAMPNRT